VRVGLPFLAGKKPLVGVVHLPPLPGSPGWAQAGRPHLSTLVDLALRDAEGFLRAGFDGLILENYGDVPFFPAAPHETVACMTRLVREVLVRFPGTPLGVNVLRNDAAAALGCALAAGAGFVRVNVHTGVAATDQGLIAGRAAATLRLREALGAGPGGPHPIALLADVLVKHARALDQEDPAQAASDALERGLADGLIVSGKATGAAPPRERLEAVRAAARGAPVWLGSGLTPEACPALAPLLDGAIAASAAREQGKAGRPLDPARARALVEAFRAAG
jgi:hypothetical protein